MMYRMRRRNPLYRAMNEMLDDTDFFRGPRWMAEQFTRPLPVDVYETEDAMVIEAALPGFEPDAVDITINRNVVTIKANSDETEAEDRTYHLRERAAQASFERQIELPVQIDAAATEAVFKNGILILTLPKAEETKPKRINIKTA